MSPRPPSRPLRRAFTLVELLIAVLVLLVVILAVGRIFSTAGQVTAYGQATADLLQEAQAIERQMRRDLANLSSEGFLAIQCIEVRNDVNVGSGGPLLDPALPANAVFRADRLIAFVEGFMATSRFTGSQEISTGSVAGNNPHSAVSRVFYGHGVQFPTAVPLSDPCCYGDGQPLAPWGYSNPFDENSLVEMQAWPGGGFGQPIVGTQPTPAKWILLRQPVLLADDGGNLLNYASESRNAAGSIWPDFDGGAQDRGSIRKGRVDVASQTPEAIRRLVNQLSTSFPETPPGNYQLIRPWTPDGTSTESGQKVVARAFAYPRGERTAPSGRRDDQMLTNALLGSAVSSFAIDWTYEDGAGRQLAADGSVLFGVDLDGPTQVPFPMIGVAVDPVRAQPWFGLSDLSSNPNSARGVRSFTSYAAENPESFGDRFPTWPVYPRSIEGATPVDIVEVGTGSNARVRTYQAAWGFNREKAFDVVAPEPAGRLMSETLGYTPLPSAIRVTMTLHDGRGTIKEGRTFQFVIPIPRRN